MKNLAGNLATVLDERRRLRSRTPVNIAIADRFSQLNTEHWREITRGQSVFHSVEYQRAFEQFRPSNLEPRYALISDGDTPLAAMCMQIARVDLTQVGDGGRKRLLAKIGKKMSQRVLVCGNLLVYGLHGVCFAPGADRELVWRAVTEVLYRVRRAEKLAGHTEMVIIKDLDDAASSESKVLEQLSYGTVATEPNMVLTLDPAWRTHDDYLGSLTSKYRGDIKNRVFKKFNEAGCVIERLDDVAAHAEALQRLYLDVHGNATFRPFTLPNTYWAALAGLGAENVVIHVARQEQGIVGFIVSLKDGDTAFAYHIGFDRAAAQNGAPIYLRLLHASLAQAIAFGCRRVSFGRTALEPKARLGCMPEPLYVRARHRHPLLNQVLQPLLRLIEHEEAPEFEPFKVAASKPQADSVK
jgi:hypothetical protein